MERLTRKCNNTYFYNVDDVFVVGKRLGAFEDFMEEVGAESLDELENCIVDLKQETQALKERWQKLKEFIITNKNSMFLNDMPTTRMYLAKVLDEMQELEKE